MKCLLSAFLALALLLPMLASCGNQNSIDTADTSAPVGTDNLRPVETIVINDACSVLDLSTLEERITFFNAGTFAKDGTAYVRGATKLFDSEDDKEGRRAEGFYVISGGKETGSFWEIPYAGTLRGEAEYQSILHTALGENCMAVYENSYWAKKVKLISVSVTVDTWLTVYDSSMNVLYSIDPATLVTRHTNPYTGTDADYEFDAEAIYYGANGTLYMATEFSIIAISPNGEKLYETGEGIYINNTWRTSDGRILVDYSIPSEGKQLVAYMDDRIKGFSAPITLPDPGLENYTLYFGEGWDYYYRTAIGLYGMNEGEEIPTLLCKWSSSGINPEKILQVVIVSENVYFCRLKTSTAAKSVLLRRPSDDEIQPRIVITLGDSNNQMDYTDAVGRFNQTNTKYYIRIRDYQKQVAEGGNTLQEDILSGNAPDIVCSSSFTGTVTNLASKGAFADLNTFLAEDPAFRENLLSSVRQYCTTNGKMYQLASTVRLNGIVGAAENLPTVQDWSLDAYLAKMDACEKQGIILRSGATREAMELNLLYNNLATFVDYENAVCSFDSELFLSTIEYLKTLLPRENAPSTDLAALYTGLRNGTILTYEDTIGRFSDYLKLCVRFGTDDITFIGSPTPNGGRPYLNLNHTYSITADSPVQKEAWAFVRYMLENGTDSVEFPVYKPLLEKEAAAQMHRYHLYSLTSTYYSNQSTEPEYDPQSMVLARLTEDHVAAVMDLLENRELYSTATAGSDATVKSLIAEELSAFFAGSITAEEAARRIQSRVSIYLAEQS